MAKRIFEITFRNAAGGDATVQLEAERAEQTETGQLRLFNGDKDQVGAFINVTSWHDTSAVKSGEAASK